MDSYWSKVANQRLSRRRALAASGTTALGAALLAACGGDSGDGGTGVKGDASGLLVRPIDESNKIQRGGTFKFRHEADQQTYDPMFTSLPNQTPTNMVYSQFWHFYGGFMKPSAGELAGDLAESWEWSPDRLQVTIKMTDKAKYGIEPNVPGASGRTPDAQDAVYSWERYKGTGTRRTDHVNELNPDAPITSMSAPDNRTVVIKLAQPLGIFEYAMTNTQAGNYFIMPKESADLDKLDVRRTQLGSGPWMLNNYTPSVGYTYKRNPNFKQDKRELPYMDQVDLPIVPEYAAGLAQFTTGAIYDFPVRAEDILNTKKEVPALEMMMGDIGSRGTRNFFGMLDPSPFRDIRVRRAWTTSVDRDLFINVQYNLDTFRSQGLPMETAWDSALACTAWEGWWINPKGTDWGKWYSQDLPEAKKLLAAAGFPNGLDVNVRYPGTGYPNTYLKDIEVFLAMVAETGFRTKIHLVNFNNEWRPQLADARGKFEGTSFIVDSGGNEPANNLYLHYHVRGSLNHGYDPERPQDNERRGDATFNDLTTKARNESDVEKRKALVHEIQKYEGSVLWFPRVAGGSNSLTLAWPAMRGRQIWQGSGSRNHSFTWLDQTKPPFRTA